MQVNIHSIITDSKVNGPGSRCVVWTQGCSKACKGCFNPETWNTKINNLYEIEQLYKLILSYLHQGNTGITFTGGDPLEQPEEMLQLLTLLNNHLDLLPHGIILFTGYTIEEIQDSSNKALKDCIPLVDLIIDGRFEIDQKINNILAGSRNQRFHFNCIIGRGEHRINRDEIEIDQEVEIHCHPDSDLIQITGFPRIDREFFRIKGIEIK